MKTILRGIAPGVKLATLLNRHHHYALPMPCGGAGKCGRCTVKLFSGRFRLPDGTEYTVTPDHPVKVKACSTLVLSEEITLELPKTAGFHTEKRFTPSWDPAEARPGTVIAVDLGTTTIAAVRIVDGRVTAGTGIPNPQLIYGDNVIDRIAAASAGNGRTMAEMIFNEALPQIIRTLSSGDTPPQKLLIAGNTAMSCLAAGIPAASLGYAPFTAPALEFPTQEMVINGSVCPAEFFPAIAGFIGGDTLAGLYACGFLEEDGRCGNAPELFIDLGTNCEIVLKVHGRFYGTTAAAGPAFERYAATAAPGVIDRISVVPGAVKHHTIDDLPAVGICGAALLSLTASLLRMNVIDRSGRFVPGALENLHLATFVNGRTACRITGQLALTEKIIAELITAKAAVAAGVTILLKKAGILPSEINRTVIAGGFAANLNIADAVTTGVLPLPPDGTFETPGNAALAGCAKAAALGKEANKTASCRERFTVVNLAAETEFADLYTAALSFDR